MKEYILDVIEPKVRRVLGMRPAIVLVDFEGKRYRTVMRNSPTIGRWCHIYNTLRVGSVILKDEGLIDKSRRPAHEGYHQRWFYR